MLYLSIGILGATVMPHNLYLHSSVVQTRAFGRKPDEKREAIRYALLDSTVALGFAFFINAAILVLGAAVFHNRGLTGVAEIGQAYQLLTPVMGAGLASTLFAAALLCSGQNSTLTGTLAGQIVMEGFLHLTLPPWLRRLVTRSLAIFPRRWLLVLPASVKSRTCSSSVRSFSASNFLLPLFLWSNLPATLDKWASSQIVAGSRWWRGLWQ